MAEVGRLLLDTHIWLWWLLGDPGLADAPCRGVVEEAEKLHRLGLSAISLWECLLLHEAGRIDLVMEPVDVAALARNIIESVQAAANAKEIALHLAVPEEPLHLVSDARKIRQILINLVGNAVKFTDDGDVTLSVHRPAEAMIAFSVIDTGPGVPEECQESIFGEFVQAAAIPDPEREGTGLGLAISRGLAAALGGMVTLESSPGEGSTFTLLLPESPVDV